jgi:hypothetical protein
MMEVLEYLFAGVATVATVLLIYLVIQIYSSNSPYRSNDLDQKNGQ